MRLHRLLVLLATLLAVCVCAPAALAQHQDDGPDASYYDDTSDGHDGYYGDDSNRYDGYYGDDDVPDVPDVPADRNGRDDRNDRFRDEPAVMPIPALPAGTLKVAGRLARMRTNGRAAVPRGAPRRVQAIIAAANRIVGKPYKWGGGHAKLNDTGYDCSGTVSFALIKSGLLSYPLVSGSFARWQVKGPGRWVTIYANAGHVYLEVAGLRLDTSSVGDNAGKGVRWRPVIGKRPRFAVRHPFGL